MIQFNKSTITKALTERILILDGAMGTAIQKFNLNESDFRGNRFAESVHNLKGNNDILNLTAPHIIEAIHDEYIVAGADIIETNTFNSNALSQYDYGCSSLVDELNRKGVEIAKQAAMKANRKIYVAGSVGPTGKTLSLASDIAHPEIRTIDFDALTAVYHTQIKALIEAGVDLLLIETVFDALNAKAALYAVSTIQKELKHTVPVMLSATINDKSGRLLTGQSLDAFYTSVSHFPLLSFGLNCSFGAADLRPFIEQLSTTLNCAISIYPNAGLPNEMGEYDESPEFTAACLADMANDGLLNIVGGCCGTTPAHIAAIREHIRKIKPRTIPAPDNGLYLSGLNRIVIDRKLSNFVNIGERTNVAGSRKFARLIAEKKYQEAITIARKQIEDGASIIDINMDDAMLNSEQEMVTFIRIINTEPDVAKAVLMIDSSHWPTLLAGLKNAQGKCIVNSISLKEGEDEFLKKASEIKQLGAAVVVMAFDQQGQAVTYERKIAIASRAYELLTKQIYFNPQDIIFDVNVLSIGTGISEHNNYAVDFIRAVKWIKTNLPGAKCSGGISNLSFSFRGNNPVREAIHSVFLYHAIRAGLDMAIVNPSMLQVYDTINPLLLKSVEDVILNHDEQATERLIAIAEQYRDSKNGEQQTVIEEWRNSPLDNRLTYALVKGINQFLPIDLAEASACYPSPISIIEGPLMQGMDRVGILFGEGKMFLPQVVKSARIMKDAVDILQPKIKSFNTSTEDVISYPRVILATVKGDVHDIGKNIVNIVLTCNNLEVIDLGVMVDNHTIIQAAKELKADIIGVSGLITPSLHEMEQLCELLEQEKLNIPLLVGGATTSKLHTAVKLAPKYRGGVIQGGDASQTVGIIKRLLTDKHNYLTAIQLEQEKLRQHYAARDLKLISLSDARQRALKTTNTTPEIVISRKELLYLDFNLREIASYIDWTSFFHFWGFRGDVKSLLNGNEEASKLYNDAIQELEAIVRQKQLRATASVRFFNATKINETIILDNGERLEMLRQQSDEPICYSLADFYHEHQPRTIGLFVVSIEELYPNSDQPSYNDLLRAGIAARLTEAFIELLHQQIAQNQPMIRPAFGYSTCPDHSLKGDVFRILNIEETLGITLTENYSIQPSTSLCGLFIPHPAGRYFSINKIDQEQWNDYSHRKGIDSDTMEKLLGFLR